MDDVIGAYEVGSSGVLEREADVVPCPICRKTFLVKDIEVIAWDNYVSCNHFAFLDLWSHHVFTGVGFCLHTDLIFFSFFCGRHMHQSAMNTVKRRFRPMRCRYLNRAATLRWPRRAHSKYRKCDNHAMCAIVQAWISGIVFFYWYQFWRVSCSLLGGAGSSVWLNPEVPGYHDRPQSFTFINTYRKYESAPNSILKWPGQLCSI